MRKALGILVLAAVAVAALAYPVAWLVDRAAGRDAILLADAFAADTVEVNRAFLDEGLAPGPERTAAVVGVYGVAAKLEPERVVFVDPERVIVPEEAPELALLRPSASHPVQAQTLYFGAARVAVGALIAAAALLLVRRIAAGGQ